MKSRRSFSRILIMAAIVIAALYFVIDLGAQLERSQWDFKAYYYAAKISADGISPYNLDAARSAAGGYVFPFLYPPSAVYLFRLFAALPLDLAETIWFWFRVILIIPLLWIWRKYFVPEGQGWQLYLLVVAAFGGAVYLDLHAGNVTIVEQILLWTGFLCLLRGRPFWFCGLIVVASLIKLLPILFLGLLLLLPVKRKWRYLIGSLAVFVLLQAIDFAVHPSWYREFLAGAFGWYERGAEFNPAFLSLLQELKNLAGDWLPAPAGNVFVFAIYGVFAFTVGVISWRVMRRTAGSAAENSVAEPNSIAIILLYTMAYAIIVPRFKSYSFMLVLPAVYYVIRRYAKQAAVGLAVILVSLNVHPFLPLKQGFIDGFWWYYPMITLVVLWIIWVVGANRDCAPVIEPSSH